MKAYIATPKDATTCVEDCGEEQRKIALHMTHAFKKRQLDDISQKARRRA